MSNLREIIRKKLKEISATNQGGASFSAGSGETYATPFAFSKSSEPPKYYYKLGYKPVPNKIKGSGLQVKKLFEETDEEIIDETELNEAPPSEDITTIGTNLKKTSPELKKFEDTLTNISKIELEEEDEILEEKKEKTDVEKFQETRLNEFDQIQNELNSLISNAKNQTIEYYTSNPGQFSIYKPTSMALEYIKKAKELLSK
jgi:ATP-dependent Lon protease